jgi:hypothetical protein
MEGAVDVWVPLEAVAEWLFNKLELPRIEKLKGADDDESYRMTARGNRGVVLDRKKTLQRHIIREQAAGHEEPLHQDDLVYRRWTEAKEPSFQAAVVIVRDASGSITSDMQYIIRVASFWCVQWLRANYPRVRVRFVLHDSEAMEVSEEDFFRTMTMGGTAVSSGIRKAAEILDTNYRAGEWNRYVILFSDGDNWPDDAALLEKSLRELLSTVNMVAYGQVVGGSSPVGDVLKKLTAELPEAERSALRGGTMLRRESIPAWLRTTFGRGPKNSGVVA